MLSKLVIALVAGVVIGFALFFLIAVNTWTVIHSGWSLRAINTFYVVMLAAPLAAGFAAATLTFHWLRRRP